MLYVDDIILASSDIGLLHETKRFLSNNVEMKDLNNASFVLAIQKILIMHLSNNVEMNDLNKRSFLWYSWLIKKDIY